MTAFVTPPTPFTAPPRFDATYLAWNTVASYDDYADAQRAVDRLSDDGFPVEQLDIVGSDLRLVERVTGRLTKGRAAAAGRRQRRVVRAVHGPAGRAVHERILARPAARRRRGRRGLGCGVRLPRPRRHPGGARDFASARTLVATRYDVVGRNGYADAARSGLETAGLRTVA